MSTFGYSNVCMLKTESLVEIRPTVRLFKALGDETRMRIVALLAHGDLCVCHVEAALSLSQPTASRHLAVLRTAGVVEARREGTWVYYGLAPQLDGLARAQLKALVAAFSKQDVLKRDVEHLLATRGPSACR